MVLRRQVPRTLTPPFIASQPDCRQDARNARWLDRCDRAARPDRRRRPRGRVTNSSATRASRRHGLRPGATIGAQTATQACRGEDSPNPAAPNRRAPMRPRSSCAPSGRRVIASILTSAPPSDRSAAAGPRARPCICGTAIAPASARSAAPDAPINLVGVALTAVQMAANWRRRARTSATCSSRGLNRPNMNCTLVAKRQREAEESAAAAQRQPRKPNRGHGTGSADPPARPISRLALPRPCAAG